MVSELITNARKYAPGPVQREPVGKHITARSALADDPGGAISGRKPLWLASRLAPHSVAVKSLVVSVDGVKPPLSGTPLGGLLGWVRFGMVHGGLRDLLERRCRGSITDPGRLLVRVI